MSKEIMRIRNYLLILIINLLFIPSLWAQDSHDLPVDSLLVKARDYYNKFKNEEAVKVYQQILDGDSGNEGAILGIAESYFALNDYVSAEKWYREALKNNIELKADNFYEYNLSLVSNKKYHEADALLSAYNEVGNYPLTWQVMQALKNIHQYLKDSSSIRLTNLSINSEEADFYPNYYEEGIVFISSRIRENNFQPLNLYFSKEQGGSFSEPDHLMNDVNRKFHVGHKVYFKENSKILYVLSKGKNEGKSGFFPMELYQAQSTLKTYKWKKPKPVPVNSKGFANFQPTVSQDGRTIFFISDRPGGFGGTDIYVTRYENETWSEPKNLGDKVNTKGNELYPFLYNNEVLYFSSDGLDGLGGLDIYQISASKTDDNVPENLGYPINSTYDDFALITKDGNMGLFSSNRLGGAGSDDLYSYEMINPPTEEMLATIVPQPVSQPPVKTSAVNLYTLDYERTLTTNEQTNLEINLPTGTAYAIASFENGISCISAGMSRKDMKRSPPILCEMLDDEDQIHVIGFAIDKLTKEPLRSASFEILKKDDLSAVGFEANHSVVAFTGQKGASYIVKVKEYGYKPYEFVISANPNIDGRVYRTGFELDKNIVKLDYLAQVVSAESGQSVSKAQIVLSKPNGNDQEFVSDENGNFEFQLGQDDQFLVMVTTENSSGIFSGAASPTATKQYMTHLVEINNFSEDGSDKVLVAGFISDSESGRSLDHCDIRVFEKDSRNRIDFNHQHGVLNFRADRDKQYIAIVNHYGYQLEEFEIDTHTPNGERLIKADLSLHKNEGQLSYQVHVYDDATLSDIEGAELILSSFKNPDKTYRSDARGLVDFNVDPDDPYVLMVTKDKKSALYSGTASESESKSVMTHQIALVNADADDQKVMIAGIIADNNTDKPLDEAAINVIEKASQEKVDFQYDKGILSFEGDKGKDYQVTVDHEGYESAVVDIDARDDTSSPLVKFNGVMVKSVSELSYTGQVVDEQTTAPVENARVKISAFNSKDVVITSDKDGKFNFNLKPDDTYLIIANTDDKSGMLLGNATKEESSHYTTHKISLSGTSGEDNKVTVVAMVGDALTGKMLGDFDAVITNKATGQPVETKIEDGVILFSYKIGEHSDFTASVQKDGYQDFEKELSWDVAEKGLILRTDIKLQPDVLPLGGEKFGLERQVLVLKNASNNNQLWEITNSEIANVSDHPNYGPVDDLVKRQSIPLNLETLNKVLNDDKATFIAIHNVFYEFDKNSISETGKAQLKSLADILKTYQRLKLEIRSYTDSRGSQAYNKGLSARRSSTVKKHLVKHGVNPSKITTKNFGEDGLVNSCDNDADCNEAAHSKNRRTEFLLISR